MTAESLTALADTLEQDQATLQRELEEIEMLLRQVATEVERHEARRVQAEERVAQMERELGTPDDVLEARSQLLTQTRRATLMQAQLDVLGGKQRGLQRFHERLADAIPVVRAAAAGAGTASDSPAVPPPAPTPTANGQTGAVAAAVLAGQEQMRREIARQMHDGPAQSIANIALQAQIVQRLFERDPSGATNALNELVAMVQQALEATKTFIFEVRPMVLDDLGLVPTLRRSAAERTRRSGVPVQFDSVGTDGRLSTEVESGLFRMIDDAVGAYLAVSASAVSVRLDWSDGQVRATISGTAPGGEVTAEQRARAAVAAARRDKTLPGALASMIHEQEEVEAARNTGLPESTLTEIEQRAAGLDVAVTVSEDHWQLELSTRR